MLKAKEYYLKFPFQYRNLYYDGNDIAQAYQIAVKNHYSIISFSVSLLNWSEKLNEILALENIYCEIILDIDFAQPISEVKNHITELLKYICKNDEGYKIVAIQFGNRIYADHDEAHIASLTYVEQLLADQTISHLMHTHESLKKINVYFEDDSIILPVIHQIDMISYEFNTIDYKFARHFVETCQQQGCLRMILNRAFHNSFPAISELLKGGFYCGVRYNESDFADGMRHINQCLEQIQSLDLFCNDYELVTFNTEYVTPIYPYQRTKPIANVFLEFSGVNGASSAFALQNGKTIYLFADGAYQLNLTGAYEEIIYNNQPYLDSSFADAVFSGKYLFRITAKSNIYDRNTVKHLGFQKNPNAPEHCQYWDRVDQSFTLYWAFRLCENGYLKKEYAHVGADRPYCMLLFKRISGLCKGYHRLSFWVRSSGGQDSAKIVIEGANDIVYDLSCDISGKMEDWTYRSIDWIDVQNEDCVIKFWSEAEAGQWCDICDVRFDLL